MNFRSLILALLTAVATPVAASDLTMTVDEYFGWGGGGWESGADYFYRYNGVIEDGELYVCGAFTSDVRGGRSYRFGRALLREGWVEMNGEIILRNIEFFTLASNRHMSSELVGIEAQCKATGISATEDDILTMEIQFRSGRYTIRY